MDTKRQTDTMLEMNEFVVCIMFKSIFGLMHNQHRNIKQTKQQKQQQTNKQTETETVLISFVASLSQLVKAESPAMQNKGTKTQR